MSHKSAQEAVPFRERLSCTIAEACEATGFSRPSIYRLIAAGRIEAISIAVRAGERGRRLVSVPSLLRLLEPAATPGAPEGRP